MLLLQVAKHIDSDHIEVKLELQDAINALDDVLYTTETYDLFNFRSSLGKYLNVFFVFNVNIVVVLSYYHIENIEIFRCIPFIV